MSFQPGINLYSQGFGSSAENIQVPHIERRDPSPTDVNYPVGKKWLNTLSGKEFILYRFEVFLGITQAYWGTGAGGQEGALTSLSDSVGTKTNPDDNGNIQLTGNPDQIIITSDPILNSMEISIVDDLVIQGLSVELDLFVDNLVTCNGLNVNGYSIINGAFILGAQEIVGPATVSLIGEENCLVCSTSGGPLIINMTSGIFKIGSTVYVMDIRGSAATANITLNITSGSDVFVGPGLTPSTTYVIDTNYQSLIMTYQPNFGGAGNRWMIIGAA